MDKDMKYNLITRHLQEISGENVLRKILEKRDITIYWGTSTTGKPHIAYFLPIFKIRDFVLAGCKVKILLADIHAFLDNLKAPIEKIKHRVVYYRKIVSAMLGCIGVSADSIEFIEGSSFQKRPEYFVDLYKILSITNENDAKRAGCEVVKQVGDANISSLVYPAMQALDEEYLGVDAQFGGVDQRKIFMYAREFMPSIKYKKRIHLMNPMIPGLTSGKMSSSDHASKIDLLDSDDDIKRKIFACPCNFGNQEDGLLAMFKFIIFPYAEIKGECVCVGSRSVVSSDEFARLFLASELDSEMIKDCAAKWIQMIIEPVRSAMLEDVSVIKNAYK